MKIVSGLIISVILFSVLFVPGCAPQAGEEEEEECDLEVTYYTYSASGCWTLPTFATAPIDTVMIYAAPKKGNTPQGNVTVAFEIVSGPHKLANLGPKESYEIGEMVYPCAGPAPTTLISEHWKKEKVYSDSPPVKYCMTDCNGDPAQFEYGPGIKPGTDTIVVSAEIDGQELEKTVTITWQYAENTCVLDLVNNTLSPTNDVVKPLVLAGGKAVVEIDMGAGNYSVLETKIEIDPEDLEGPWLLNIGNSPTNNGACGDSGQFTNDSELDVTSSDTYPNFILQLYADQDFYVEHGPAGAAVANLVPLFPTGTDVTTWILRVKIADGRMCALVENTGALRGGDGGSPSPYIFSLGGPDAEAGQNDFVYYAAFNRVIGSSDRTGSGVVKVTFHWGYTWDVCAVSDGWDIP